MDLFKRGLKSIVGNKIKSIILLLLVIILGSVTASAVIMTNGIHSTTLHLRRSVPALAMVTNDFTAIQQSDYSLDEIFQNQGRITLDMVHKIGALSYVRDFTYTSSTSLESFELNLYTPESPLERYVISSNWSVAHFHLTGLATPTVMHIEENIWELAIGRLFTEEDLNSRSNDYTPILVSENFANQNGLALNSVFTLYAYEIPEDAEIPQDILSSAYWRLHEYTFQIGFSFEIVGIIRMPYEPTEDWDTWSLQKQNQNRLMIPSWKVEEINTTIFERREVEYIQRITPTWLLYDPLYFEAFAAQANDMLPQFNIVEDMSFLQRDVLTSMSNVNNLMNQALIFAIGATSIVLTLTILLYLRDRRHEIGVYLALGEKKIKISLQILFEILTVTLVGIVIAVFIGNIVSTQMSNFLLQEAFIDVQETEQEEICERIGDQVMCLHLGSHLEFEGFGSGQMDFDELIEIFDVSLNARGIIIFSGVALTTVLFSTLIPIMYLLKLQPKDILLRGNIG